MLGYDKNAPLSKPINLRMERGEKIAIVGTNGIGKTTFLKSVLGLIKPVSGKAELGDYLYKGYLNRKSNRVTIHVLKKSGMNFLQCHNMRCARHWLSAD